MGLVIGLGGNSSASTGGGGGVVAGGLIQDMDGVTWEGYVEITDKNITEFQGADFRYCTSLQSLFQNFEKLVSVGELKNTGKSTSAYYMFYYCQKLKEVPAFDTANVTSMGSMFGGCSALQTVPEFDTSNVTNMSSMFSYCTSLQSVGGINMIKAKSDSNANNMFYNCTSLVTANISNLGISLDLSYCKVLSVDSVLYLFNNAKSAVSGKTIQLNSLVFDQLTEEQIAIATEKGFSVTSVVRS